MNTLTGGSLVALGFFLLFELSQFLTPGILIGVFSLAGAILTFIASRKRDKATHDNTANATVFSGFSDLLDDLQADRRDLRAQVVELRERLDLAEQRIEECAGVRQELADVKKALDTANERIALLLKEREEERP